MTALELLACVDRLSKGPYVARLIQSRVCLRPEMDGAYCQHADCHQCAAAIVADAAKDLARDARSLMRLTGELGDES